MKGGSGNQQPFQARRVGALPPPGMQLRPHGGWRSEYHVSLIVSILPGPIWASGPWELLGWVKWKLVFIKRQTVLIALYTLSYLILTTLGVRYNKPLFVDKIIGSERLSNLATITLQSRTGIEIFICEPMKENNLVKSMLMSGWCGCGDSWQ